jgi:hypothetical protein
MDKCRNLIHRPWPLDFCYLTPAVLTDGTALITFNSDDVITKFIQMHAGYFHITATAQKVEVWCVRDH